MDCLPFGQIKKDDEITIWSQFLKHEELIGLGISTSNYEKKIGRKNCYTDWQQNRMGDSIKDKVCTGLGEQHFLLG
ncbi:hypothetical protein ACJIZ3_024274 [Penstemon smallii]|uniref:Uncharacterized protein n=1 Tax=Penstemon smallii TaxID=265156 RepID=A0ABD3TTV2_9LAMI